MRVSGRSPVGIHGTLYHPSEVVDQSEDDVVEGPLPDIDGDAKGSAVRTSSRTRMTLVRVHRLDS